jgi:hypothetical protein
MPFPPYKPHDWRADFRDDLRAAMLGIGDWFDWQAFEDVPESYLRSI